MSDPGTGEVPEYAADILRYFLRNPNAADTLEGVARWRLMEEQVRRRIEEINEAMRWLVAKRFLLKESRQHSQDVFALNHQKTAEAKMLLAKGTAPRSRGPRKARPR